MNEALREQLSADIAWTVSTFGTVLDQTTGEMIPYDPSRVAPRLQHGILEWASHTPRDTNGMKLWLTVLASRQVTKTVTTGLALWARTAYNPGVYSATIADTKDRADDLFRSVSMCQDHCDPAAASPTIPNRESRQLTFAHGGKYRTLSVGSNMVGIGRAVDNLHLSECPFADGIAQAWNGIVPAIINRREALVVRESTPAPMHMPGAEWYKDECAAARKNQGRSRFLFEPYFGSLLNERRWDPSWKLDAEEQRLLDTFGPKNGEPLSAPGEVRYLTLENIAFRREVMDNDSEVRRNPELFLVYYPTDYVTCWQQVGGGAIPGHVLEKHLKKPLLPWPSDATYVRYKEAVDPNAIHAIGVDPAGWMGGDQASFQAAEIWATEWNHVSEYSSNTTRPDDFARAIIEEAERLNDAWVIVENNGVGLAVVTLLEMATRPEGVMLKDAEGRERRYHLKNLYYHKLAGNAGSKPGVPANAVTNAEALVALVDGLLDKINTPSMEFIDQCGSYKKDKEVQESEAWKVLNPGQNQSKRRAKHHWDRVSAWAWLAYLAQKVPHRFKPVDPEVLRKEQEEAMEKAREHGYTHNELEALRKWNKRQDRKNERLLKAAAKKAKK